METKSKAMATHRTRKQLQAPIHAVVTSQIAPDVIDLNIEEECLRVAVVQLKGPKNDGKVRAVNEFGRETLQWGSKSAIDARIRKSNAVMQFLNKDFPGIHLCIFPEYSLPVKASIPSFQRVSDDNNIIIITGGDNILQQDNSTIYNQCAIVLPGRDPHWVTKRRLSQWELDIADEHMSAPRTMLRWNAQDFTYISPVYICLDFTHVLRDGMHELAVPSVHIVSMCSPSMQQFYGFADTLLTSDNGASVILCNCVGIEAAGNSGVFAVTPGGKPLEPAMSLSSYQEEILIFELHGQNLVLPKRSSFTPKSPIRNPHHYVINESPAGIEIVPKPIVHSNSDHKEIGILNPEIFGLYGKKLSVTFVNVDSYGRIHDEELQGQAFECYSVLGASDLMISVLQSNPNSVLFELSRLLGQQIDLYSHPYFVVNVFHKVLGCSIDDSHREAFTTSVPNADDVDNLFALANDWNSQNVNSDDRIKYQAHGWVLGKTDRKPGEIDAVMTVFVSNPDGSPYALSIFEQEILPVLKANPMITSIYEGDGHKLSVHYLLRIRADKADLYGLVQSLHVMGANRRLVIQTKTYFIMKKWSDLELRQNLLLPELPPSDEEYRQKHLRPLLPDDSWRQLVNMPVDEQKALIGIVKQIRSGVTGVEFLIPDRDERRLIEKSVAEGLIDRSARMVDTTHARIQGLVEDILTTFLNQNVSQENFDAWRKDLNIVRNDRKQLSYTEKLRFAIKSVDELKRPVEERHVFDDLYSHTVQVRNSMMHRKWEEVSITQVAEALIIYLKCTQQMHRWQRIDS